jgi:cytochrome b561
MITLWSSRDRYGVLSQTFHWVTALLVVGAFLVAPGGSEEKIYSAASESSRRLHELLGLAVVTLTILRLAWRVADLRPQDPPMPALMHRIARATHATLYVLLLAIPFTGVIGTSLKGHAITPLFLSPISLGVPLDHNAGKSIALVHGYLGDAIIWLGGLHAAAALFHHFILHDRVLRSMLPLKGARDGAPRIG